MNKNVINIIKCNKPNICFIGDVHGELNALQGLMKKTGFTDTVYIICGDVGIGFHNKEYYSQTFNKLTKTASKFNCEFIFVRGNHDSKKWFDKQAINRKCFKTIPDYSVVQTPTHNILCVGGGTSIDRTYRKEEFRMSALKYSLYHGCSLNEAEKRCPQIYWEDESCYYDSEQLSQLKLNNIQIDIVCTHTCPSFCGSRTKDSIKFWLEKDPNLEHDLDEERTIMDDIYKKLKEDGHLVSKWVYGHFHYHCNEHIDDTDFIMLDMCRYGNFDIYDIPNEI